jgi:hypothetical protein
MKKVIVILVSVVLSGCMYQSVSNEDIERAEKFCEGEKSEVEEITANMFGDEFVDCKNREGSKI